eukprot:s1134_g2.t1
MVASHIPIINNSSSFSLCPDVSIDIAQGSRFSNFSAKQSTSSDSGAESVPMARLARVCLAGLLWLGSSAPRQEGPVVGIVASPLKLPGSNSFGGLSWIWSTYVESLHDAGARVVPLLPQAGREVLLETLQHVDAVLWTGCAGMMLNVWANSS